MGITKQYLRYISGGNLNLIADSNCNIIFITLESQEGRFVAVGACEHVYIWDLRLGEKVQVLSGDNVNTTCLAASPNKQQIAVGYANGSIKTFNLETAENISTFVGHNSEVTCLAYDYLGHRLVSGSKDTDIILWDIVAESGICRLIGHKGIITKVSFMKDHNIIISSSKDTFVKFWDLNTEHNFKTLIDHRSEVWDFTLVKNDQYLVTGCNDRELHVWEIYFTNTSKSDINVKSIDLKNEDDGDSDVKYPLRCTKIGNIVRVGKGRLNKLTADFTGQVIGCYGNDNTVELFHFLSEDQVKNKKSKRINKLKKNAASNEKTIEKLYESELDTILKDKINRLPVIKISNKVKALDIIMGQGDEFRVCTVVNNNTIELHSVLITEKCSETQCLRILSSHGHRTDVRAIAFSSDSLAFATVSGDSVKLWNRSTLSCLRTVETGYALSVIFVPGDRHLIVGLKNGNMLIIDIASGDILEEISAHENELWSLALLPSSKGFVSGSGDKTVKFWQFELIIDPESDSKAKVLSVIHYKTLKLEESVLCVRISPNNRFIATALLDSTVKIFFLDTFKFFVSLYGHKLPVLCIDISSDSTLIATGSADRNIKIWGLDFGDCHKSLFAHDDSVTGIAFVPKTHYLFTCGKDGKVKEWDADSFQKIVTLQGHVDQAFNCTVSPNGMHVVSCGSDKVVRIYNRSSEILVLEDEAEEEREKQMSELITGERTSVQGRKNQILPTRKTVNSEKAAELILECLDICKKYKEDCLNVTSPNTIPPLPLLMQSYKCNTIEEFLLETIKRVHASDFDEAVMLLPYSAACEILQMLPKLLKKQYQAELIAKLTLSLIQAHHGPIVTSQELLPQIEEIKSLALEQISALRNTLGFNLFGMTYIQREIEETEGVQLFKEATKSQKNRNSKRKNKEKSLKRAVMIL
ncbi:PREDICTED: WD repeat-containing protein 3 [Ceratosolen solmsi marchali]|uniref:WD repeat-containing protein 3 n=1 Tax=Ceratosolen solmsi marchali TaxID=326594 RepID=A0AAJ7E2D0_9HYME|nr:PREDICTED: WD repeat-containing protein 3 [Ceratosolen solmsi marchali]